MQIMSLYITSLNSGSNGNCYYIGNETEAILIDAGISCRETEKRMARLGLSMGRVKAIFVSHEHTDHIKGIPVISRKHQLPIYITPDTMVSGRLDIQESLIRRFISYEPVVIGGLRVTAFPKLHDAVEPHSFMVSSDEVNIGIFTDIGAPCEQLIHHFKQCHAAFLEANYDETMLETGRYPYFLKNRIRGGHGHLSNTQALEIFREHRPAYMTHLLLSHLSRDNNNPELVHQLFTQEGTATEIVVASRDQETSVFKISANNVQSFPLGSQKKL